MSDIGTLRPLPVLISCLILLAGCQAGTGTAPAPTARTSPPASIPVSSTPGPTSQAGFDAVHVNDVLGPAVAEIIVTTSGGGALGSGFVIQSDSAASYILTNNHVVTGARTVQVLMPDGRHFTASVQGADPIADIAVVKVSDKLPVAQFGDSSKLKVGQPVVAIGTPLGNTGSVTSGVISALHRTISASTGGGGGGESLPDVIQTDAAINPGNSGGPLADGNGLVIGVNTAGDTSASGIGYAIPSLVARRIATSLIAGRKPGHPYLGIQYQDLSTALEAGQAVNGYGVVVNCVVSSSPAAKGGLQKGDVIEKIDGVDLNNGQTLGGLLQIHDPGDQVVMGLVRGSATQSANVTLGERPSPAPSCQ